MMGLRMAFLYQYSRKNVHILTIMHVNEVVLHQRGRRVKEGRLEYIELYREKEVIANE